MFVLISLSSQHKGVSIPKLLSCRAHIALEFVNANERLSSTAGMPGVYDALMSI